MARRERPWPHASCGTHQRSAADQALDPLRFEDLVESGLPAAVYRAKGLLRLNGIPQLLVFQMAGRRTNPFEVVPNRLPAVRLHPAKRRRPAAAHGAAVGGGTKLVLIGRGVKAMEAELFRLLDACIVA
eukprot:SAG11_NODE_8478_length_1010_cov_2.371021_2_plen_129_part_00